jgi:uncharacterized protein (TIGR03382 family)
MRTSQSTVAGAGAAALLELAAALLLHATPAQACGGFFCNNQPIDQAGEEIIFSVDEAEGTVRAIIKIQYQGEAKDFAWVLPVQNVPTVSVSSNQIFQVVRGLTQPQFQVEWKDDPWSCLGWGFPMAADSDGLENAGGGGGGSVVVVDKGEVGPYDYVILESNDAAMLVAWLNENGFVQPPESTQLIAHYLESDFKFVAIKLQQDKGAGEISPIVLEMVEQNPCVPLVLTQIAASPDMPVRLWVLGGERAVPTNWFDVKLNLKKIDWVSAWWNGAPSNYEQLVTDAVNEAEGHGFVTEYAGTSEITKGKIYNPDSYKLDGLAEITDPAQFVMALQGMFTGTPELLNLLREFVPLPASAAQQGIDEQSFYNCPDCYPDLYAEIDFDPAGFIAAIEEKLIQPLADVQAMFDSAPYLTRMFSTVSPDEMNRDPLFAFNGDLPDVSNVIKVTGEAICGDDNQLDQILITLPDGTTYNADVPEFYGGGPLESADDLSGEPSAAAIALVGPTGLPLEVPRADLPYYDKQLDMLPVQEVMKDLENNPNAGPGASAPPVSKPADGGGCNATGGPAGFGLLFMLFAGAAVTLRRRYTA